MTKRNKRGNLQDECDQRNNQDEHCYDQGKKQPQLTEINYRRTNIYNMQINKTSMYGKTPETKETNCRKTKQ